MTASQQNTEPGTTESIAALADGIIQGDRTALSRGITLVESTLPSDTRRAEELLELVWPSRGNESTRVAITGPPGAGKSTLVEAIGSRLISLGHRVAVLAVDPSSHRTRGSILGDKTRMRTLATDPSAYVRPSPTGGSLGGVTRATREAIILCEVAGFDTVLVETVGVGQSEVEVEEMVDYVLLVVIPGAGDDLQGIKRGILEVADIFAINKSDVDSAAALEARSMYRGAVSLITPRFSGWKQSVTTCSATTGSGVESILDVIEELDMLATQSGEKTARRSQQMRDWFNRALRAMLLSRFLESGSRRVELAAAERTASAGHTCPTTVARDFLDGTLLSI